MVASLAVSLAGPVAVCLVSAGLFVVCYIMAGLVVNWWLQVLVANLVLKN